MNVPLLDLKAQYHSIKSEITRAMTDIVEKQAFILGAPVEELEKKVAAYTGCSYGVGVSSGSDALLVALLAENIGPGDEVITTPYTFFATAGAIYRTGAKPVFVDIDPMTYNISPDNIAKKISTRTRAIIPVHLYGQCADMAPIMELARDNRLIVIEDAAQAIGAEYIKEDNNGLTEVQRAGSIGDYGCFSFFPSKNLGAFGDGGMVVTNDEEKAEKVRVLRAHGSKPKYYHKIVGGNFRLDALQAAILLVKFTHLEEWNNARQKNALWYDDFFRSTGLIEKGKLDIPATIWRKNSQKTGNQVKNYHIFNQYILSTPMRDNLQNFLKKKGVGTAIYYPLPLHLQECFSNLDYKEGDFPISEEAAKQTLAIPVYPELTTSQRSYVAEAVLEGLNQ